MADASCSLLDEENDVQRPEQQGVWCALQRDASLKCLALTLLICGCLGAVTWCRLAEVTKVIINFSLYPITRTRQMSPCEDGYLYVPVAFLALLYLVYLVECWHCTARLDLQGPRAEAGVVLERIRLMKEAQPVVWWKAVCYHYVRRKRQVTRYRHGDAYTSTQVYYERVNSHAAGACFSYAYCGVKDISRELRLGGDCPLTKIRFSKGFAFANVEAAAEFEEQRARFFGEYERVDDYLEMREGLDVAHFRDEQLTVAPGPGACASLHSPAVFWLCSLLLLSWPLRLLLQCRTAYLHYQVTKLFGVNYETSTTGGRSSVVTAANNNNNNNNGRSVSCCQQEGGCEQRWLGSRGGLSHCTADSGDLEWCCRDNAVIVPSYSEALLMDNNAEAAPTAPRRPTSLLPQSASCYSSCGLNGAAASLNLNLNVSSNGSICGAAIPRSASQHHPVVPVHQVSSSQSQARHSVSSAAPGGWTAGLGLPRSLSSVAAAPHQQLQQQLVLYYPSPLVERCPEDPFQGRSVTTPTEEPPPAYEEALRLPVLTRLRRSLTERGDICRPRGSLRASAPPAGSGVVARADSVRVAQPASRALLTMETSL